MSPLPGCQARLCRRNIRLANACDPTPRTPRDAERRPPRRAAHSAAKPADLPILQDTKFDLIVNLKTAGALSVTIPPLLLLQATQVLE
jgi:hypothetical protein